MSIKKILNYLFDCLYFLVIWIKSKETIKKFDLFSGKLRDYFYKTTKITKKIYTIVWIIDVDNHNAILDK